MALRVRPARPVLACASVTFLTAPSFLALAHVGSVGAVGATRFLAGFAVAFYGVVWSTTIQRQIPPDKLARVSSYDWVSSMAPMPVGYALVGPLSDVIGVREILTFSAAWILVSTSVVVAVPSVRRLRSRVPTGVERPAGGTISS